MKPAPRNRNQLRRMMVDHCEFWLTLLEDRRPTRLFRDNKPYYTLDGFERRLLRNDLQAIKHLLARLRWEGGKQRRIGVIRLR